MKEKFNLSNRIENIEHKYYVNDNDRQWEEFEDIDVILVKDVKEFIKRLKETIEDKTNNSYSGIDGYSLLEFIDKLAGSKLTQ